MTKQLNKKGTSLVELIAVIVIMGIIAGIAVPVTIAVINRQKKNAAAKSAEAVISTIKQYVNEYLSDADTTFKVSFDYGSSATNVPTTVKYNIDSAATDTDISAQKAEFAVENLKATGSITATYTLATAKYTYTFSNFKVNDYTISVDTNGKVIASKTATTPATPATDPENP